MQVYFDNSLQKFNKEVWCVEGFSIGFSDKLSAEFFEKCECKKASGYKEFICGFCKNINGEYEAHFINLNGKEIIKPIYKNKFGYFLKNGKYDYCFTKEETLNFKNYLKNQ